MSLVIATWAVAGFTLLLVIVAALTARFAVMAFRKQAEEVSDQKELIKHQGERLEIQRNNSKAMRPPARLIGFLAFTPSFQQARLLRRDAGFQNSCGGRGRQLSACTRVGVQHGIVSTLLALAAARKSTGQGFSERIQQICTPGIIGPFMICARSCGALDGLTWLGETSKTLCESN